MSIRVWLITGASSGLGRSIARAALDAGDIVCGAVRRPEAVADLVDEAGGRFSAVQLDVTDSARIDPVVTDVIDRYGRIDVLVNNAGRGLVGAVEETTDEELRAIFDVHFFGPVSLIRAVLPHMRAQRSGTIVQISSYCGQASFPGFTGYCSSKFAIEGVCEGMAGELAPLGIKVLLVEPGALRTGFFGSKVPQSAPIADYADTVGPNRKLVVQSGIQPGDPEKVAKEILAVLEADDMPLRLPLGDDAIDVIRGHLDKLGIEVDAWESVGRSVSFELSDSWGPQR